MSDWLPKERPPFEVGNQMGLKHGAYCLARMGPRAEEHAEAIAEVAPLVHDADAPALKVFGLVLARLEATALLLENADENVSQRLSNDARQCLVQLIKARRLSLPADEELLDELANVRLRENAPGVFRIDHDPGRHDDRAIALGLASLHLVDGRNLNKGAETIYDRDLVPEKTVLRIGDMTLTGEDARWWIDEPSVDIVTKVANAKRNGVIRRKEPA